MKSIRYITISLILLASVAKAHACWFHTYTPGEYYVFYAYDENDPSREPVTTNMNIVEWQQYTFNKATYDDIREVVYTYPLENLERIADQSFNKKDTLYKNTFVRYLFNTKDREAIQYLILAKKCELRRALRSDQWWYPTKEDLENNDLREILNEALAYKGTKLNVRYCLQAIRAAYTMGEYDLCLQLWNDRVERQPVSAVRALCEDYIGGIYFQNGDYETAIRHYANTMQSSSSFWWCIDNMGILGSDVDRIKLLYKYFPSSPELPVMVQKICREAEDKANAKVFDGVDSSSICYEYVDCGYPFYLKNRDRYMALRDFALQAASEGLSDDPAMWQYTASFLTLIDGNALLAGQYLLEAERMKGSLFIKNNIKVLHIMTDAMTGTYDATFEADILPQLQWLDKMIQNNLTDAVKAKVTDWDGSVFGNFSFYYFNDMMRKITLSVMVPQYMARRDGVKVLLLTGMASERLRTVTNFRKNRKSEDYRQNIDFYTDLFMQMESFFPETIVKYRDTLKKGGNGAFERFFAARCYKNSNYFNEIIGTKYMRLEQFDQAVEYLSKVPRKYDPTLNIYEYFRHDPFSEPYLGRVFIDPSPGYKLRFAIQMASLQKEMGSAKTVQGKTEAMYRYALGMMRATNDCWALLYYKRGYVYMPEYLDERWEKEVISHYNAMFDEILQLSDDRELKAKCLAAHAWDSSDDSWDYGVNANGKWGKLVNPESIFGKMYRLLASQEYASTGIVQSLFSECDTFFSYQQEEK